MVGCLGFPQVDFCQYCFGNFPRYCFINLPLFALFFLESSLSNVCHGNT